MLAGELAALVERRWQARVITEADGTTKVANLVFVHERAAVSSPSALGRPRGGKRNHCRLDRQACTETRKGSARDLG